MTDFLIRACGQAQERVEEAQRLVPVEALRADTAARVQPPGLAASLRRDGVAVIAEIKRASPSAGRLAWVPNPAALAGSYARGGAAAISVLTEPVNFLGTLADLTVVADRVALPVLRKDFVVDAYQVWEAGAAGAAAILLIVAALEPGRLVALLDTVGDAGLEALIEVHDADEVVRALAALEEAGVAEPLIGVNARDLHTLEVDLDGFEAVRRSVPEGVVVVAESGIKDPRDVARLADAGADAVLVGEHLVTAADPVAATRALVAAGRGNREAG